MKKYVYILVSCAFFAACDQKEEAVYGKGNSYVKRTGETITKYTKALEEAPNGWLLTVYAGDNQQYGGYNFLVSFAGGKVKASSEVNTTETTSDYSLSFNEKAILSFDTYNEVLHYFVEPSFLNPHGKVGDNQYEIQSYEKEVFTLKGKRSNNLMTLVRFQGDKSSYLNKIRSRASQMKTVGIAPITLNGKQVNLVLHPTNHQFVISEGTTIYQKAFVYTDKGLKLYEPIEIGGKIFTEFYISDDNQELSSSDGSVKTTLVYTLPYYFQTKSLILSLVDDGCSSNTVFSKLYERYRNFTYSSASYSTSPQIRLGSDAREAGITFRFYQDATTRYTLDFLPVAGKENQVNIVEGIRSLNWNVFNNLYPIVEALIQNAPYEMTDIKGDGSQYRLTSAKNAQITFVTTPAIAILPYDFTRNRTMIQFATGYVSNSVLTVYNSVRSRTRIVNGARVRDILGNTIYFGKNGNNIGFHFYFTRTPTSGGSSSNVSSVYNIDFLPVPCNIAQMNMIDKGKLPQNTNWTAFSYLSSLIDTFTRNAPYTMYDDGSGYVLWTSVKDSNIWFYTYQ